MLQRHSSTDSVENLQDNKTFFCSELIAACLKVIGLLPKDICCAQYWPGTFSSDSELKLLQGAKLEDELQVEVTPIQEDPGQQKGLLYDQSGNGEAQEEEI